MKSAAVATVFSTVFSAAYFACFYFDVALFMFYPEVGEFHAGEQAASLGPPIVWYGWMAAAAVASIAVALVTPVSWAKRISPTVCWSVTVIVLVVVLFYEKRWFL